MQSRFSHMNDSSFRPGLRLLCVAVAAGYAALTACSSADAELARFVEDTKKEPGGRVEPLPEIKPYETFLYAATDMRSPFLPSSPGAGRGTCRGAPRSEAQPRSSSSSIRSTR